MGAAEVGDALANLHTSLTRFVLTKRPGTCQSSQRISRWKITKGRKWPRGEHPNLPRMNRGILKRVGGRQPMALA